MAVGKDQYAVPQPLLSPKVKDFLGEFHLGRLGLHVGRKIIGLLRRSQDPVQRKRWIARFLLPVRNILLLNRPLTVSFDGVFFSLVPQGTVASDLWVGIRRHTQQFTFILRALKPGMIVFDVGANAGLLAITAAKKIGGDSVFAFEPSASTCNLLRRNLLLNHLNQIHLEQIRLGDAAGKGTLQLQACGSEGLNAFVHPARTDCREATQESVRVSTIDEFMRERGVPRVDLLRVDVEGAELIVLRGARNLLERADAPDIMYDGYGFLTQRFGYHPVEILWFLESYGYTLFSFQDETGKISEVNPDYRYDSTVIAAKPSGRTSGKLQTSLK